MTMTKQEHWFAKVEASPDRRIVCGCGHVEHYDGDSYADLVEGAQRMNEHIRGSYTDEEWEEKLKKSSMGTVDTETGVVTLPPKEKS